MGTVCPKKGDKPLHCDSSLPSWMGDNVPCELPEDSKCEKMNNGAWGCVLESFPCGDDCPEPTISDHTPEVTVPAPSTDEPSTTEDHGCHGDCPEPTTTEHVP